jgi:hypothetical protein
MRLLMTALASSSFTSLSVLISFEIPHSQSSSFDKLIIEFLFAQCNNYKK